MIEIIKMRRLKSEEALCYWLIQHRKTTTNGPIQKWFQQKIFHLWITIQSNRAHSIINCCSLFLKKKKKTAQYDSQKRANVEVLESTAYHSHCHCETVFPLIKLDTLCIQVVCVHLLLHFWGFLIFNSNRNYHCYFYPLAACKLPLRTIKTSSTWMFTQFHLRHSDGRTEFGTNKMKHGSTLPCINGSGLC